MHIVSEGTHLFHKVMNTLQSPELLQKEKKYNKRQKRAKVRKTAGHGLAFPKVNFHSLTFLRGVIPKIYTKFKNFLIT